MRLMTLKDHEAVHALWCSASGIDLNDIDDSREGIRRYLQRNPKTCFVKEKDGQIIGAIMAGHDGRRGTLHHLVVHRDHRRQGIGTALTQRALEALHEQGIRKAAVFVYHDNPSGMAFWKKLGFILEEGYAYLDKELWE